MDQSPVTLIIGCGRFGSRAAAELLRGNPQSRIIVVDKSKRALRRVARLPVRTETCDGVVFLRQILSEDQEVDSIIPAVPLHLAFEFILSQLKPLGAKRSEIPPLHGLPNPMAGPGGDLYTSFADFLCPENCPEPLYCSVTGEHRPEPLFRRWMNLEGPFESKVIRSLQLGQGVGGFRLKRLLNLTEELKKKRDKERLILISTACRCHGVTSALSFDQ